MNIYQFTHTDLDGAGCDVLTKVAFPGPEHFSYVSYVGYHNVNEKLAYFMRGHKDGKEECTLLITDICPSEETAAALDEFQHTNSACKVRLFDHHKTQAWVNKYSWARHDTNQCGTFLYYDWLVETGRLSHDTAIAAKEFAELVDVYDRWLLEHPKRKESEGVNSLLYFLGFDRFVALFSRDVNAHRTPEYEYIIEQLARNQETHVKKIVGSQCVGSFVREDVDGNKFCIMVAEKDVSQICHEALDRFAELDYSVCVNPVHNKVDLRSREDGVDVGAVAKRCGGGGHPAASGFELDARAVLVLALKGLLWKE